MPKATSRQGLPTCSCDQLSYIEKTGHYCVHYEALLGPVIGTDSRRIFYVPSVESNAVSPSPEDLIIEREEQAEQEHSGSEEELRAKLTNIGLSPKQADVLLDRILHGRTFQEIALERGYSRAQGAHTAYSAAIELLKKKGYR